MGKFVDDFAPGRLIVVNKTKEHVVGLVIKKSAPGRIVACRILWRLPNNVCTSSSYFLTQIEERFRWGTWSFLF